MRHFQTHSAALVVAFFLFFNVSKGQTPCQAWSIFPWHDWVAGVRVGSTEHLSGKSQFSDFSLLEFETVAGQTLPIELISGFSWENFDENWHIWVDFDQNGTFDGADELLFSAYQKAETNGTATAKTAAFLTIPSTAPIGKFRLRVAMRRGAEPLACGAMDFGEIEDFTIKISSGQPPAPCSLKVDIVETWCIDSTDDAYRIGFQTSGNSAFWKSEIGGETFSGQVGDVFFTPKNLKISAGEWLLRVFDPSAPACKSSDKVVPPEPCSSQPSVPTAVEYCPLQAGFPWHDWIEKVKINATENASSKSKYSDFTQNAPVFELRAGETATVELTAGFSYYTHQERFKIWIDFNQNGIFEEPAELFLRTIMAPPPTGKNAEALLTQLVLPADLPTVKTRMRVAMARNAWPSGCGSFHFGEAEDYAVEILKPHQAVFHGNEAENETENQSILSTKTAVFPNPASDFATLFFENEKAETAAAELFDATGRLVFSKKWEAEKGQNAVDLPLAGLADGLYFWKIWRGEKAESGRLAVRK